MHILHSRNGIIVRKGYLGLLTTVMYYEPFIAIITIYNPNLQFVKKISIILIYETEFWNWKGIIGVLWRSRYIVTRVITGASPQAGYMNASRDRSPSYSLRFYPLISHSRSPPGFIQIPRDGRLVNFSYGVQVVIRKLQMMQPHFKLVDSCRVRHNFSSLPQRLRITCNYHKLYKHYSIIPMVTLKLS